MYEVMFNYIVSMVTDATGFCSAPVSHRSDMSQLRVALNEDPGDSNTPPTEVGVEGDVAKQLQSLMLRLKGEFMAQDGRGVNYQSLRESTLFKEYKQKSLDLKTVDVGRLNVTERKCFFISIHLTFLFVDHQKSLLCVLRVCQKC